MKSLTFVAIFAALALGACGKKDGGSRNAITPSACFGNNFLNSGQYRRNHNGRCVNYAGSPVDERFCQGNFLNNGFNNNGWNGNNNWNNNNWNRNGNFNNNQDPRRHYVDGANRCRRMQSDYRRRSSDARVGNQYCQGGGFNNGFNDNGWNNNNNWNNNGFNNGWNCNGLANNFWMNNGFQNAQWQGNDYATQWCNATYGPMFPDSYFVPVHFSFAGNFNCVRLSRFGTNYGFNNISQHTISAAFQSQVGFIPRFTSTGSTSVMGCDNSTQQDLDRDGKPACKCGKVGVKLWFVEVGLGGGVCNDI